MKETFTIAITKNELNRLLTDEASITDFLNQIFQQKGNAFTLMGFALQQQNRREGGGPEVTRIIIISVLYYPNLQAGTFKVIYDINFAWGCEDIRLSRENQESGWNFTLDIPQAAIIFEGTEITDQRSTREEF